MAMARGELRRAAQATAADVVLARTTVVSAADLAGDAEAFSALAYRVVGTGIAVVARLSATARALAGSDLAVARRTPSCPRVAPRACCATTASVASGS